MDMHTRVYTQHFRRMCVAIACCSRLPHLLSKSFSKAQLLPFVVDNVDLDTIRPHLLSKSFSKAQLLPFVVDNVDLDTIRPHLLSKSFSKAQLLPFVVDNVDLDTIRPHCQQVAFGYFIVCDVFSVGPVLVRPDS
eukprot:TRINITY_DN4763_c1_g1_i3.p2 TRINITY_DN4763_c1_g1~~TRINITY_DN4763_c1_g1_i3.p2  ORF type:complete len:135 (+),score=12.79 TRINITY_DN4763_c1_g1_i3:1-405(+)